MALYNDVIDLINITYTEDEIGQEIEVKTTSTIFCNIKSISQSEFYQAAQAGLRPSITFIVHLFEYEGQKKVKYNGLEYNVIRTYATGLEEIELICERVGSND